MWASVHSTGYIFYLPKCPKISDYNAQKDQLLISYWLQLEGPCVQIKSTATYPMVSNCSSFKVFEVVLSTLNQISPTAVSGLWHFMLVLQDALAMCWKATWVHSESLIIFNSFAVRRWVMIFFFCFTVCIYTSLHLIKAM